MRFHMILERPIIQTDAQGEYLGTCPTHCSREVESQGDAGAAREEELVVNARLFAEIGQRWARVGRVK